MSDDQLLMWIAFVLFFTIYTFIVFRLIKKHVRKYMPLNYENLMRTITEVPIASYDYPTHNEKGTGAWNCLNRPGMYQQTKILFFKNFLIITVKNFAQRIGYDAKFDFFESKPGTHLHFYGNVVITSHHLLYNICNIRNQNDFYAMKRIIENYKEHNK